MIDVNDLKNFKEANEKTIVKNNAIIEEKKVQNFELEAENRAFEKLIKLYEVKEMAESVEQPLADEQII